MLVYCRVSDSGTCQLLLELGKIKVNGVVVGDEVMKVSEGGWRGWLICLVVSSSQ